VTDHPDASANPPGSPAYLAGLLLTDRLVVAVGGGRVNSRRVPKLLAAGAVVTVVAPELHPALAELAEVGRITWERRSFVDTDVDGAWYVLAATDDAAVNAQVAAAAEARHTFCVRADRGDGGSAWTPATGQLPDAIIGVLANHNPLRSRELRDQIVGLLGQLPAAPTVNAENAVDAEKPASPGPKRAQGEVILIGGGPGDPDLLTVGGLRALQTADVVLYDHLAPQACLAETKPDAVLIDVSKTPGGRQTAQEEINSLLIEHARRGATVVRFKGGDPFVLGRGSEEWLACAEAGVPVRVIPGVSSAIAGPELAGIPLTHRGLSQDFTVVSGHVGPDHPASTVNWDALAQGSGTVVVLMGVAHLTEICEGLVARGLDPDTPAAVVAEAAMPGSRVITGTAATLPRLAADAGVQPPALTVIGAVVGLRLRELDAANRALLER